MNTEYVNDRPNDCQQEGVCRPAMAPPSITSLFV